MDKSKRTLSLGRTGIGLALLFVIAFDTPLLANEAIASAVKTVSGDYVWYEDFTFKRVSYVGFLYYDEHTRLMRYYSPHDAEQGLAEKSIDIYITHDGSTLTGERVIGGEGEDNVAVVNYLHDLFYDMDGMSSGVQELTAFGGEAVVEMDDTVPIYGIRRIAGNDNKVLFQVITVGHLTASDDASFTAFKGGSKAVAETKAKTKKVRKIKKGKPAKYQAGTMSFAIDSAWQQNMANMWMLGNDAVASVANVGTADDASLVRRLKCSSGDDYIDWRTLRVSADGKRTTLECTTLGIPSMRTWRVLMDGCLFSLTVKDEVYQANRSYFEGILRTVQSTVPSIEQ